LNGDCSILNEEYEKNISEMNGLLAKMNAQTVCLQKNFADDILVGAGLKLTLITIDEGKLDEDIPYVTQQQGEEAFKRLKTFLSQFLSTNSEDINFFTKK
jgi:hypothetical protein